MKKLMLLMIALATCVWGEVFIKDSIRIVFPQDISLENIWQASEECFLEIAYDKERGYKKAKQARIFMNDLNCYSDVCSSILDTSVFFLEEEIVSNCFGYNDFFRDKGVSTDGKECMIYSFYILSDASHSLIDVIQDEFKRFQECEFFDLSKGKLDSILLEMEAVLSLELMNKYHSTTYVIDCGNGKGCMQECPLVGEPCFSSEYTSMDDILAKRNVSISVPYRMDFAARITVENGRLRVPTSLESRAYMLYGLNGRVLRSGLLRNNMALPREPSILRVKDYGDVYLK